jgi:hypothetical protein
MAKESTERPNAKQVVNQLQSYSHFEKDSETLLTLKKVDEGLIPESACLCIEGVFCQAAIKLGFEGEFLPDDTVPRFDDDEDTQMMFVQNKARHITAPSEVFEFLGLPKYLEHKQLKQLGLNSQVIKNIRQISGGNEDENNWFVVNDMSEVSLKDLLSLACKLVKENNPAA